MHVVTDLKDIPKLHSPCVLSIGTFDGLHLGHLSLLYKAREITKSGLNPGTLAVLTFSNHPSELFTPKKVSPRLSSPEHKLQLFQEHGVDLVISLTFNRSLSEKPYDHFLKWIKDSVPFSHLVLGSDALFGKNRDGSPEKVINLGNLLSFKAAYHPKFEYQGEPISSSLIRKHVTDGNLEIASKMLGRPYSIVALFSPPPHQKDLFFAEQVTLSNLCLPPQGTYKVMVKIKNRFIPATAEINKEPQLLSVRLEKAEKLASPLMFEVIF